ncbi:hypothetical protein FGB62_223g021 [Gracilaria domingensis]|nr:hypothetical protein FGB62_223g021 [Gracilaria domingensis]
MYTRGDGEKRGVCERAEEGHADDADDDWLTNEMAEVGVLARDTRGRLPALGCGSATTADSARLPADDRGRAAAADSGGGGGDDGRDESCIATHTDAGDVSGGGGKEGGGVLGGCGGRASACGGRVGRAGGRAGGGGRRRRRAI